MSIKKTLFAGILGMTSISAQVILTTCLLLTGVFCDSDNTVGNKDNNNGQGSITDADGNSYHTVTIGTQVWMAENLRTTKFNDGTTIPLVKDSIAWKALTTPGYCYYKNTTNADTIRRFGAIYNWCVVNTNKLAPAGWHVPDTTDWHTLKNYLITNGYNWDKSTTGNKIAKSLAGKTDWMPSNITGAIGNDMTHNNATGFSAFPFGNRSSSANTYAHFGDNGGNCDFWTSTAYGTIGGWYIRLCYDFAVFDDGSKYPMNVGTYVRLVKD